MLYSPHLDDNIRLVNNWRPILSVKSPWLYAGYPRYLHETWPLLPDLHLFRPGQLATSWGRCSWPPVKMEAKFRGIFIQLLLVKSTYLLCAFTIIHNDQWRLNNSPPETDWDACLQGSSLTGLLWIFSNQIANQWIVLPCPNIAKCDWHLHGQLAGARGGALHHRQTGGRKQWAGVI